MRGLDNNSDIRLNSLDHRVTPLFPPKKKSRLSSGPQTPKLKSYFFTSNRSRFITFTQAATKSFTNFSLASLLA